MTIADIERLTRYLTNTGTTAATSALAAADILILENKYYEEVMARIVAETAGSDFQNGDINYTGFPTFPITMSNGVAAYDWVNDITKTSPLTATGLLTIMGVEVLDNGGIWHPLDRISLREIHERGSAQPEYQKTNGQPTEYELRDNMLVLYPAPDNGVTVTLASGLRIYYLRTAQIFTSTEVTTGTKEPGFPSPFHDLMSYGPASDYMYSQENFALGDRYKRLYEEKLQKLLDFISRRDQAVRSKLTVETSSFR